MCTEDHSKTKGLEWVDFNLQDNNFSLTYKPLLIIRKVDKVYESDGLVTSGWSTDSVDGPYVSPGRRLPSPTSTSGRPP